MKAEVMHRIGDWQIGDLMLFEQHAYLRQKQFDVGCVCIEPGCVLVLACVDDSLYDRTLLITKAGCYKPLTISVQPDVHFTVTRLASATELD